MKTMSANESAFPVPPLPGNPWECCGLTKLELLAAMAMAAQCANPDCEPEDVKHNAIVAVRNADALLAAIAKEQVCEWREKRNEGHNSTGCGHKDYTIARLGSYCPYCGKKIKEVK
jgi:hypothetical protein